MKQILFSILFFCVSCCHIRGLPCSKIRLEQKEQIVYAPTGERAFFTTCKNGLEKCIIKISDKCGPKGYRIFDNTDQASYSTFTSGNQFIVSSSTVRHSTYTVMFVCGRKEKEYNLDH